MKKSYLGKLLVANPRNPRDDLAKSILIVVTYTTNISIALQINAPHEDLTLSRISQNIGIDHSGDQPVYFGGQVNQHKIHVIHSLDWQSVSTTKLNDQIGITNDVGVLMAISRNQGPKYFKACSGYYLWEDGMLDKQINPRSQIPGGPAGNHRWGTLDATIDIVFKTEAHAMWANCIDQFLQESIDSYMT